MHELELRERFVRRSEAHAPPTAGLQAVACGRGGEAGGAVRPPPG